MNPYEQVTRALNTLDNEPTLVLMRSGYHQHYMHTAFDAHLATLREAGGRGEANQLNRQRESVLHRFGKQTPSGVPIRIDDSIAESYQFVYDDTNEDDTPKRKRKKVESDDEQTSKETD